MANQYPSNDVDRDAHQLMKMTTRVERTLTDKGSQYFVDTFENLHVTLARIKEQINFLLGTCVSSVGLEEGTRLKENLLSIFEQYCKESEGVIQYLESVKTQESNKKVHEVRGEREDLHSKVVSFIRTLDNHCINPNIGLGDVNQGSVDLGGVGLGDADLHSQNNICKPVEAGNRSLVAGSSRRSSVSHNSDLSSVVIRQRAETEAAHVKLESAKREAAILKQKAELEAELNLLKNQTAVDEAEARLKVLQDADGNFSRVPSHENLTLSVTKRERTEKFVRAGNLLHSEKEGKSAYLDSSNNNPQPQSQNLPDPPSSSAVPLNNLFPSQSQGSYALPTTSAPLRSHSLSFQPRDGIAPYNNNCVPPKSSFPFQSQSGFVPPHTSAVPLNNSFQLQSQGGFAPQLTSVAPPYNFSSSQPQNGFNPLNSNFVPPNNNFISNNFPQFQPNTGCIPSNPYSDLANFFMRKEVSLSRLHEFDDNPDTYSVWKAGFCDVTKELAVSPVEEMDLLIKYLGPESKRQALSIRASNASNPHRGLYLIWERLEDRFASPEIIEASLKRRLSDFPKLTNKENKKLYELSDLLSEIEARKGSDQYKNLLAYFDTSSGVSPIVSKLPFSIQEKWTNKAMTYKETNRVSFPPFTFFSKFVRDIAKMRNDPSFCYESSPQVKSESQNSSEPNKAISHKNPRQVRVKKTETQKLPKEQPPKDQKKGRHCAYHSSTSHTLNYCRSFRQLPISERKDFLLKGTICSRCCNSTDHLSDQCKRSIYCGLCKSSDHVPALHEDKPSNETHTPSSSVQHGGESPTVKTVCTQVCGNVVSSRSCAKILLVRIFPVGRPQEGKLAYVILDDQSNQSLARSNFFDMFNDRGPEIQYSLISCAGRVNVAGRKSSSYCIQPLDASITIEVPSLIECNDIPNQRDEIPTPEIIEYHPHLNDLKHSIPPLDTNAEILLLIGRDVPSAHHIHDQRIGPLNAPFAQRTSLGWTIIGDVCLDGAHLPSCVSVLKTSLMPSGRPSLMHPCDNSFVIREHSLSDSIFSRIPGDEKCGLSVEDKHFLHIMDSEFKRSKDGNWEAPLPFRMNRPRLGNNKEYVYKRMVSLIQGLERHPEKKTHMIEFMEKIFERNHAEVAPPLSPGEEYWYLPLFGVYNDKKPGKIRVVFDSSSKFHGLSLNDVLLTGPDLTNSLLGILLRFRREAIAITADIEQMFHNFRVCRDHRNFLRFFWYRDNNPNLDLVEYRMTVHVFGNTPSPAVATYGLRKSVEQADQDVRDFVSHNFYVDDGLKSFINDHTAIITLQTTQRALLEGGNLRLHKIASNSKTVLTSFPPDDLASGLKDLDITTGSAPLQSSLGLIWDINSDSFTYKVSNVNKPFTRRGVLSTIHSLYDPIGFIAPVVVEGRLFLREITTRGYEWDERLPDDYLNRWVLWTNSLSRLETISIPRMYSDISVSQASKVEIHIFADASKEAIAAVSYLKVYNTDNSFQVGFLLGKAKVAPLHGHTIPRLELCAAVMATEIFETVSEHIDIVPNLVQFYTDSKVVLGYINNEKRRFYIYVSNRVDRIRRVSCPSQWKYVPSESNPADLGTRGISVADLQESPWLHGPSFLRSDTKPSQEDYPLIAPESDREIRPLVNVAKTSAVSSVRSSVIVRLEKFSSWSKLLKSIAFLQHLAQSFTSDSMECKRWHYCNKYKTVEALEHSQVFVVRSLQLEHFPKEIEALNNQSNFPSSSSIASLSPYIDQHGILRVGGRLSKLKDSLEVHPVIIPKKHFVAVLLVRHFHEQVCHQGRHITEGAIRAAGYWIIGGRRVISSVIHQCVTCRRTRGQVATQKMGDLPEDRLQPCPPFTYIGVDVFGPWHVTARRTRGGCANSKRWAVLFTCLASRAIHVEVIEEMTASSFINSLRRFIALRGPVKQIRSDRGTNFVGAVKELGLNSVFDETGPVGEFLSEQGCTWIFNPPHASHMGGSWERMIGVVRRILDVMFLNHQSKRLTHEVLVTFMAEVCAIVNNRPIIPVSTDPEDPVILSPSVLLTHKVPQADYSFPNMDVRDSYRSNWKYVQTLAEEFWRKWHKQYIHNLQAKRKWPQSVRNLQTGDVVLMKEVDSPRNQWPLGIIVNTFPGDDGLVRKVELHTVKNGKRSSFVRPVSELIYLV